MANACSAERSPVRRKPRLSALPAPQVRANRSSAVMPGIRQIFGIDASRRLIESGLVKFLGLVVENSLLCGKGQPGKIGHVLTAQSAQARAGVLRVLDAGRKRANSSGSATASGGDSGQIALARSTGAEGLGGGRPVAGWTGNWQPGRAF